MTKKYYKSVSCEETPSGTTLCLDGKPARTPAGNSFVMHSTALARAVAEEWRSQGEIVRKEVMLLTQVACVAIDFAGQQREAVIADMLPYGGTDLICYRAGHIPQLAYSQAQLLDPIVAWAGERFGIALRMTEGIMPVEQPEDGKAKLAALLSAYDDWKLAAVAAVVKPLGSVILALALVEGRISAEEAFHLSHLEENFETGQWGGDEEKERRMQKLREEITAIEKYLRLLSASGSVLSRK